MKAKGGGTNSPFAFILSIVNDKPINKKVHPAF